MISTPEPHIHADFVSGCRELAARTSAALYLSAKGGNQWQYRYAADYPHRLLHGGACWQMGHLQFQAVHPPGHTPEHMAYRLTDMATTQRPIGIFTGDFCNYSGCVKLDRHLLYEHAWLVIYRYTAPRKVPVKLADG